MLTVDVEAFARRAQRLPFQRLIWGHLENGEGGILGLMRAAERHGVVLSMFVDYAQVTLYGNALLEAAQEIHRRGHDLQLHCHPEVMPREFWDQAGVPPLKDFTKANYEQAKVIFDYIIQQHGRVTSETPRAFRGGGYLYNAAVLDVMARNGVVLHSGYNAGRPQNQLMRRGIRRQFVWSNDCLELPISCVASFRGAKQLREFNFNGGHFESATHMVEFLDAFHAAQPGDVAVLVMHSWSFSKQQPDGPTQTYDVLQPEAPERFDAFLSAIDRKVAVVTAQEVARQFLAGERRSGYVEDVVQVAWTEPSQTVAPAANTKAEFAIVPHLMRKVTQHDIYLANSQPLTEQRVKGFRPRSDVAPWPLLMPLDWGCDPHKDANWQFQLHAWRMTDPYLREWFANPDPTLLYDVLDIIDDWWRFHFGPVPATTPFSWHDMATGIRAMRLAFFLDIIQSGELTVTSDRMGRLLALVDAHATKLQDRSFLTLGNHGLFQLFGLNLLGLVMGHRETCSNAQAFASEMFVKVFETQYSEECIHREHSPEYHAFVTAVIRSLGGGLRHFTDAATTATIERAEQLLPWLSFPSGHLARIGDTVAHCQPPRSVAPFSTERLQDLERDLVVADLSRSGYVIIRSAPGRVEPAKESMLFLTGMSNSKIHKHADDLSFELFEFGRFILVDTGKYGYAQNEMRRYITSASAHNTISLKDIEISPRNVPLHGSALRTVQRGAGWFEMSGNVEYSGLFRQNRELYYRPTEFLVIRDSVKSEADCAYVSSLHFAPDLKAKLDGHKATIPADFGAVQIAFLEQDSNLDLECGVHTTSYLKTVSNEVLRANACGRDRTLTWLIGFSDEGMRKACNLVGTLKPAWPDEL